MKQKSKQRRLQRLWNQIVRLKDNPEKTRRLEHNYYTLEKSKE
jgi:hypothetical protein